MFSHLLYTRSNLESGMLSLGIRHLDVLFVLFLIWFLIMVCRSEFVSVNELQSSEINTLIALDNGLNITSYTV